MISDHHEQPVCMTTGTFISVAESISASVMCAVSTLRDPGGQSSSISGRT